MQDLIMVKIENEMQSTSSIMEAQMIIKPGGIKGLTPDKKKSEQQKDKQNINKSDVGIDQSIRSGEATKRRGDKK